LSTDEVHFKCFIASPGDCANERKIAAAAVQRIDRLIGERIHYRLEPRGWERDAFPDVGRPQEIINKILDESDIAVFIFWHRLGTDAGLGHTGSEEEFYRTLQRRYTSGEPRMLLYFNEAPPPSQAVDLGQLARVRDFRRRLDEGRELLYGTFRDGAEWRERLEDALADELFRRAKGSPGQGVGSLDDGGQAYLLERMIHNLQDQAGRLEITGHDPKTLAHLKTEIDRLRRLQSQIK
jgi:hypothetical protein